MGYWQKILVIVLIIGCVGTPALVWARMPNDPNVLQWSYKDLGVYSAWDKTVGSDNVVVAIIDNGFDYLHPDLRDNVWQNLAEIPNNNIDDDHNGYVDDVWGWNFVGGGNNDPRPDVSNLIVGEKADVVLHHGTVVAGIIGAVGNNGLDGAGINWRVKLMDIKVIDNTGEGDFVKLGLAIKYAVDNGADVINLSVVGYEKPADMLAAIDYAYQKGVVVVAAAGNNMGILNNEPMYPVCADAGMSRQKIFGVSAIKENHRLAVFSNVGSDCVDITAPGVHISSTLRFSPTSGLTERYGGGWSGTSFATPFVTGAAALIKSIQPTWQAEQIYQALASTTQHTLGQDETVYANLFGAGLLQIDRAINYAWDKLIAARQQLNPQVLTISSLTKATLYNVKKKTISTIDQVDLKNNSGLATYQENNQQYFVVARPFSKTETEFSFYNVDWEFIKSWRASISGQLDLKIGDLIGDEKLELVAAPKQSSRLAWAVYNLKGKELNKLAIKQKHTGVTLGMVKKNGVTKSRLVAWYRDDDAKLALHEFDYNLVNNQAVPISLVDNVKGFTVGDVDGDGNSEYIFVSAPVSGEASLHYFDLLGKEKRQFSLGNIMVKEILLNNLDFDLDGKDDIVLMSAASCQSATVWNYRGKKLDEWLPFGGEKCGEMEMMVY